jgi:hypothetical protein
MSYIAKDVSLNEWHNYKFTIVFALTVPTTAIGNEVIDAEVIIWVLSRGIV